MELSKINLSLYGKSVRVGADAPSSIEGREKWLVKHRGMTPVEAHDTVRCIMTLAIYKAAEACWQGNIPDDKDIVTWIDRQYDIILFEAMKGGDLS